MAHDNEVLWKPYFMVSLLFFIRYLQSLISDFNHTADDLMVHLTDQADGKTKVSMLIHLTHFALDVIGKVKN